MLLNKSNFLQKNNLKKIEPKRQKKIKQKTIGRGHIRFEYFFVAYYRCNYNF